MGTNNSKLYHYEPVLITIANRLLKKGNFISKQNIADVFEKEYPDEVPDNEKGDLCILTEKTYYNSLKHAVEGIQEILKKKGKDFCYEGKGRSCRFAYPYGVRIDQELKQKATKDRIYHLQALLGEAIREGFALSTNYSAGFQRLKDIELHPYRLKLYNNRWFVVGLGIEDGKQYEDCIFALDRIMTAEKSSIKYIRPKKDYEHFFDDIVGVTHIKNRPRQVIEIVTLDKYTHYRILTKPIHSSQKEKAPYSADDGEGVITINVIPNKELMGQLLSFGPNIRVTAPQELADDIKQQVQKMLKNYEIAPSESD